MVEVRIKMRLKLESGGCCESIRVLTSPHYATCVCVCVSCFVILVFLVLKELKIKFITTSPAEAKCILLACVWHKHTHKPKNTHRFFFTAC